MEYLVLSQFEDQLARAAERAKFCDFMNFAPSEQRPVIIRAEVIRAILLGIPVKLESEMEPRRIGLRGPGLRLRGAWIDGALDLDHGSTPEGTAMSHLAMEACQFRHDLKFSHARLKGLNLTGSKLNYLRAYEAEIEGTLDLSFIASMDTSGPDIPDVVRGQCWVDCHGAVISGGVDAKGAKLKVPIRQDFNRYATSTRYALDLGHSRVDGSVNLTPGFSAQGGVSVALSHVDGNIRAAGAQLSCGEGVAFTAENADIRGLLDFGAESADDRNAIRFDAQGNVDNCTVNLVGARIASDLRMQGARIAGRLMADNAQIGGDALLGLRTGRLNGQEETLRFTAEGRLEAYGIQVRGDLELYGAHLGNGINAQNANIGGSVRMACLPGKAAGRDKIFGFSSQGEIRFYAARIGSNVNLDRAKLNGTDERNRLTLDHAIIAGRVYLCAEGLPPGENRSPQVNDEFAAMAFSSDGILSLQGTRITGNFVLNKAHLGGKLDASSAEIMGDVIFEPAVVEGDIDFSNAIIGKKLQVCIDNKTVAKGISFDLSNTRVEMLDDEGGEGFGQNVKLTLEGFTYSSMANKGARHGRPTNRSHDIVPYIRRKKWLKLQYIKGKAEGESTYHPGPYRQLVQVFRRQGANDDSARILRQKLKIEGRKNPSFIMRSLVELYGFFFGFGLSSKRAVSWFVTLLFAGWICVSIADFGLKGAISRIYGVGPAVAEMLQAPETQSVLVIDAAAVSTVVITEPGTGSLAPAMLAGAGNGLEIPCGDQIHPSLYALDQFVPVLDLHQETKCTITRMPQFWPLHLISALYSILGWIFTSLTILTLTGVLRRYAET